MRFLIPSVAGARHKKNTDKDFHFNPPINLELVTDISLNELICEEKSEYASNWQIVFYFYSTHTTWYFPDKLTRDHRYEELLNLMKKLEGAVTL